MSSDIPSQFRHQYENLLRENQVFKAKIQTLEQDNRKLKRSVYELSSKLDTLQEQQRINSSTNTTNHFSPFDLTQLLKICSPSTPLPMPTSNDSLGPKQSPQGPSPTIFTPVPTLNTLPVPAASPESLLSPEYPPSGGSGASTGASGASKNKSLSSSLPPNVHLDPDQCFFRQVDLRGHSGAVYCAQFSPCGRVLASGALDKRIKLWDVADLRKPKEKANSLTKHTQLVIELKWSKTSQYLLSASYDHSVHCWDVEQNDSIHSSLMDGFVQTVGFDPVDEHVYYAGTSQKQLHVLDTRTSSGIAWTNESMINSLSVCENGIHIVTGDAHGYIKTWDSRMGEVIEDLSLLNGEKHHPISHLHLATTSNPSSSNRFMAVNSYDNVLRLYDRGSSELARALTPSPGECCGDFSAFKLVNWMSGPKIRNWPIKCSIYCGFGEVIHPIYTRKSLDQEDGSERESRDDQNAASPLLGSSPAGTNSNPMLIATGSADSCVYIYDVNPSNSSCSVPSEEAYVMQKLEGHTDRVYGVDFHPMEPVLASAAADGVVKLWYPTSKTTILD